MLCTHKETGYDSRSHQNKTTKGQVAETTKSWLPVRHGSQKTRMVGGRGKRGKLGAMCEPSGRTRDGSSPAIETMTSRPTPMPVSGTHRRKLAGRVEGSMCWRSRDRKKRSRITGRRKVHLVPLWTVGLYKHGSGQVRHERHIDTIANRKRGQEVAGCNTGGARRRKP